VTVTENIAARCRDVAAADLAEVYNVTGIDLSVLPVVAKAEELAPVIGRSIGALAQDRYKRKGIPWICMGRSVRYARGEVARYLMANRQTTVGG
jgi:hypothetical protein